ncbi:low molecular weight protein tyrosine phosphatase family protein [Henriciella aquimarina]|uniref:low molecular weight protein tyrosine phosphatase family protein n=1 Tax=Henriciella aquimarina TaxID=545261 RepID=UPI001F3D6F9E|nr:hypothetical protein [Henriciella aquimarina]
MSHPKTRAERRALARKLDRRVDHRAEASRRHGIEKDWKKLYWRRNKLHRARQIGKIWPYCEWEKLMTDAAPVKVLFICSRNRLRSPTAEAVFQAVPGVEARSAGTARDAVRQVNLSDIRWADLVVCMEDKHANRVRADFRQAARHKRICVLAIPDDYKYMQEELVSLLRTRVMPLIRASE